MQFLALRRGWGLPRLEQAPAGRAIAGLRAENEILPRPANAKLWLWSTSFSKKALS
jgi:hypothetical protein